MVMVMVTMVMTAGGESGACANQHQKAEEQNLLHGMKRTTIPVAAHPQLPTGTKTGNACILSVFCPNWEHFHAQEYT